MVLVVFVCFVSHTLAAALDAAPPKETMLIDHRTPYREGRGWVIQSERNVQRRRAQKRQESDESDESTTTSLRASVTTTFSIALGTPESSSTSTSTSTSRSESASASASPLPKFLDSMPAGFKTTSCPVFINNFLQDSTFEQCYPLSMLLEVSAE